jgi:tetratricopeptide (TPR) repeat protein
MATAPAGVPQESAEDSTSSSTVPVAAAPPVAAPNIFPEQHQSQPTTTEGGEPSTTRMMMSPSLSSSHSGNVYDAPTMNLPIFIVWILPLFAIALYGRLLADVTPITIPVVDHQNSRQRPSTPPVAVKKKRVQPPSSTPSRHALSIPSSWPTSYVETVKTIHKRRRRIPGFPGDIDTLFPARINGDSSGVSNRQEEHSTTRTKSKRSGDRESAADDNSAKVQAQQQIKDLTREFRNSNDNKDLFRGILAAEAMRYYTMTYHEGGTYERQSIALYNELIVLGQTIRRTDGMTVHQEVVLDYHEKSHDAVLCGLYTALGKTYFLASLFERAVTSYDSCLERLDNGDYLDARNARGSALIVLGRYEPAGRDLLHVIYQDHHRFFVDAFTGLARVLEAQADAVDGGWEALIGPTNDLIPLYEYKHKDESQTVAAAATLARLHHVLFTYHEKKTKDYKTAYHHLEKAHMYKLSTLPPWNGANEKLKVMQLQSIFTAGFWGVQKTGSDTKVPIFIIGFVRSGSTLLERILDAHPDIVGTGEDSVFNGRLGDMRNAIVAASNSGGDLADVTESLAEDVIEEMYRRWRAMAEDSTAATDDASSSSSNTTGGDVPAIKIPQKLSRPKRLADKMLTNYYNVGFIEMLYPNALILHVAREPMDSIFSAFKHDFPTGTLDYTSDLDGVTDLYRAYRDVMDHWDQVLPGRITHIRYEDMVNDFAGTARAIVNATGLPWHDAVLQFHRQKHAVNTFSSTQVRKGVYKDSLQFWKRYEQELAPLVQRVGDRVHYHLQTTLAGYTPPVVPSSPPPETTTTDDSQQKEETEGSNTHSSGTDEL